MKRRSRNIIKLCVFVLLLAAGGAIVNVAVAWGCASWSARSVQVIDASENDLRFWRAHPELQRYVDPRIENLLADVKKHHGFGVEQRVCQVRTENRHCGDRRELGLENHLTAGWPMRGLHGHLAFSTYWDTQPPLVCNNVIARSTPATRVLNDWSSWRDLPTGFVWPGFAINTVFYAVVLWLLLATPGGIRRRSVRHARIRSAPAPSARSAASQSRSLRGVGQAPGEALRVKDMIEPGPTATARAGAAARPKV